jgi:hypothetical protein
MEVEAWIIPVGRLKKRNETPRQRRRLTAVFKSPAWLEESRIYVVMVGYQHRYKAGT